MSRCAEHGLRHCDPCVLLSGLRLAARRLRLPFHRPLGIAPSRASGMAFLGFLAPPVYCNGWMLPSAVPRPRSSPVHGPTQPLRIPRFPCPDLRHVQGSPVSRCPLRASPSHLPDLFHPGDTHGILPFRGLTSSRAGLPLGRPCPSFPWLASLTCHAREPEFLLARVGQLPTFPPTVPGFRTRIVQHALPVSLRCVPSVAVSRAVVGCGLVLQLRGLPGILDRSRRLQRSRRISQTLPRTSKGRAWRLLQAEQPLAQHARLRMRTRSRHRGRSPFLPPATPLLRRVAASLLGRTGIQGLKPGSKRAGPGRV